MLLDKETKQLKTRIVQGGLCRSTIPPPHEQNVVQGQFYAGFKRFEFSFFHLDWFVKIKDSSLT